MQAEGEVAMRIRQHKLVAEGDEVIRFDTTKNTGGKLDGGRPRFLVIHYTAGGTVQGAVSTFKNDKGEGRVSAHIVIGHEGELVQLVPFDTVAWHAGESRWKDVAGLNRCAIGIELVNYGKLVETASGTWQSAYGHPIASDRVVVEEHKNHPGRRYGWQTFTPAQNEACLAVARAIVAEYKLTPWDLVGHDDISPLRKIDPGPAFDMDRFRGRVFGREDDSWNEDRFKVASKTGLNMRVAPSIEARLIKNLADGTEVHVVQKAGLWWLVAEIVNGNDDTTGYVHSHWLMPG